MFQDYKNYGKCARFEQNGIIALVTVEIGPRVIFYGRAGKDGNVGKNFLNEDLDRNVSKGGEFFDKFYKKGEMWYLYGGHRVWKSPEELETYTADNAPLDFTLRENGGSFTTHVSKRLDFTIDVEMAADGSLHIKNIIMNKEDEPRTLSVWSVTVAAKGGTLIVPFNDVVDELNPTQNLVQWPYNPMGDERVSQSHERLVVRQTNKVEPIKLGMFIKKGRAYYVLGGETLKIEYVTQDGKYGDFYSNFETYTNCHILEAEGLSACRTLQKGETSMLEEAWSILAYGEDKDGKIDFDKFN